MQTVLDREMRLKLPTPWLEQIDALRGDTDRSNFIRRLLRQWLKRRGRPVQRPQVRRGIYDRRPFMRPETLAKTEARARRATRRRERPTQRRPKQPPQVFFVFAPTGNVGASDLAAAGLDAGYINMDGSYDQQSRHDARVVQAALRLQMAADPGRKWPERFHRFAGREL